MGTSGSGRWPKEVIRAASPEVGELMDSMTLLFCGTSLNIPALLRYTWEMTVIFHLSTCAVVVKRRQARCQAPLHLIQVAVKVISESSGTLVTPISGLPNRVLILLNSEPLRLMLHEGKLEQLDSEQGFPASRPRPVLDNQRNLCAIFIWASVHVRNSNVTHCLKR